MPAEKILEGRIAFGEIEAYSPQLLLHEPGYIPQGFNLNG